MIENPYDIIQKYPVRKSRKQKAAFRSDAVAWFEGVGYSCREEKGNLGIKNLVIGDPETARFVITAHYDTCAVMPFPNLITPCNLSAFLGYQMLLTFAIIALALVPAILVGLLSGAWEAGFGIWYLSLLVLVGLIMVGPANKSNVNDNTSGIIAVMETAAAMPEELRDRVCFVLFDLEEAGLMGSSSYSHRHKKASQKQLILNMDCVGDGNQILLIPTSRLKKNSEYMSLLRNACRCCGEKHISLKEKGFAIYPSDQSNFPYGVGICAAKGGPFGLYISRIHTPRDTILEPENVTILHNFLVDLVKVQ